MSESNELPDQVECNYCHMVVFIKDAVFCQNCKIAFCSNSCMDPSHCVICGDDEGYCCMCVDDNGIICNECGGFVCNTHIKQHDEKHIKQETGAF